MIHARKILSSLLILAHLHLITVGCATQDVGPHGLGRVSGEELFEAVMFTKGELGKEIVEILMSDAQQQAVRRATELTAEQQQELDDYRNALVAEIDQMHPRFMPWFEESMQSGDPAQVESALQRASDYTLEAVQVMHPDAIANLEAQLADPEGRTALLETFAEGAAALEAELGVEAPGIEEELLDEMALVLGFESALDLQGAADDAESPLDRSLAKMQSDQPLYRACSLVLVCMIAVWIAVHYQIFVTQDVAVALLIGLVIAVTISITMPEIQDDPGDPARLYGERYQTRSGQILRDLAHLLHQPA